MSKKQAISTVTTVAGVGDRVRPVHAGEYHLYGHGRIVAIKTSGSPYQIKFPQRTNYMCYRG